MECCRKYTAADYSRSALEVFNSAFYHHNQVHMAGFDCRNQDIEIMELRYRAHSACLENPKLPSGYGSTILYIGAQETLPDDGCFYFYENRGDQQNYIFNDIYLERLDHRLTEPYRRRIQTSKSLLDLFLYRPWRGHPHHITPTKTHILHWQAGHIENLRRFLRWGDNQERYLPISQVRLFMDDDGMFGFVPEGVMPGDLISRTNRSGDISIVRLTKSGPQHIITTRVPDVQQASKETVLFPGWPHLIFVRKGVALHYQDENVAT
jgi:hypothetical protein